MRVSRPAFAALDVVLEIRIAPSNIGHGLDRLVGQRGPPEVRMDHDACCVDKGFQAALASLEEIRAQQIRVSVARKLWHLVRAVTQRAAQTRQMAAHDLDDLGARVLRAQALALLARDPGIDPGKLSQ